MTLTKPRADVKQITNLCTIPIFSVCTVLTSSFFLSWPRRDIIAKEHIYQPVHSDLYLHHLTCYHRQVDKGWNWNSHGWSSLPALTSGHQQTFLNIPKYSDFNWNSCKHLWNLHLHCQQQTRNKQSKCYHQRYYCASTFLPFAVSLVTPTDYEWWQ